MRDTKIKCDGIIFDVDGTLWDSTFVVKDAWNEAIVAEGFDDPQITADRLKGLFGLPMYDIIRDIMPDIDDETIERISPAVYEYEHNFLRERPGTVYEGILEVMREISKKIPVFIVSNCQGGYVELFMEKTGTEYIVKDHLCPADTGVLKAANIKMIVDRYGLKNPLYVGDTIMDEKACKEAECPFCFASYGFGQSETPDYVIEKAVELLDIIDFE